MITLTEDAVKELHGLLAGDGAAEKGDGLRLSVQRGGCAGMSYQMKLDHRGDRDSVFERDGVSVYVDPESLRFLDNCKVDYSTELSDTGFKIINPNAARSCGCGTSFEPAGVEGHEQEPYDPSKDGATCATD